MSYRHLYWLAAAWLGVQSLVSAAPATQPASLEQRIGQLLKQLDSDSYEERVAAVEAANQLPPEALPLLLAAEKQPGISPEVRSNLEAINKTLKYIVGKQSKYQTVIDFYRGHLVGEYDRVGHHDPKWEEPARGLGRAGRS